MSPGFGSEGTDRPEVFGDCRDAPGTDHNGAELLDYVIDPGPFRFVAGSLSRTDRPGLGVEIDEAAVRAADRKGHTWRNPV